MKPDDAKYKDYYELIILGHNAGLAPEQIYDRFVLAGITTHRIPNVNAIRRIGRFLIGKDCRWHQARSRAWVADTNGYSSMKHGGIFPFQSRKFKD